MDTNPTQAYIFGSIFVLANRLQVLGDSFDPTVTVKQWLFIACVEQFEQAPTLTQVAQAAGYSRQNAKRIATDLVNKGLLTIDADLQDRRALRLSTTPECVHYFRQREEREATFIAQLFAGIDEKSTTAIARGIEALGENIVRMEKTDDRKAE